MSCAGRFEIWAAAAMIPLVMFVAACAGDGTGLDEFGNPLAPDRLELTGHRVPEGIGAAGAAVCVGGWRRGICTGRDTSSGPVQRGVRPPDFG